MLLINLYGAPGAGKSTGAMYITSMLKMLGFNAEYVPEYAKDKIWEENWTIFKNQLAILGKQSSRLSRLKDKVEVVVTDSPLLLNVLYAPKEYPISYKDLVLHISNEYNSLNYFIKRVKKYNPAGRLQNEQESDEISIKTKDMLDSSNIDYKVIEGKQEDYNLVVEEIRRILSN